jgi:hypothetical protein
MDDSKALIIAIGAAYVWIAFRQGMKADWGVSLMFLGYALAQWGVYMQAK